MIVLAIVLACGVSCQRGASWGICEVSLTRKNHSNLILRASSHARSTRARRWGQHGTTAISTACARRYTHLSSLLTCVPPVPACKLRIDVPISTIDARHIHIHS